MLRMCVLLTLTALLLWHAAARAEDGYTIRLKELGVGDTVRVEKDETQVELTQFQDPMGRSLLDRSAGTGEVSSYRETILAKEPNRPPGRLKRTYDRAMKREGNELRPLVYDGRTVLIERKKDRYHFWLTGRGELKSAEATLLDREFNGSDERFGLRNLLPAGAVRAGAYPWPVNMAPLVKDLARTGKLLADPVRAKGSGQLKKVWRDEDGRLLGEFHFQLELPLSSLRLGKDRVPLRLGAKGVSQMTLELCIDGSHFHLVHKDTMRVEAAGPHVAPDGSPGLVAITVQSDNKGSSQLIPSK